MPTRSTANLGNSFPERVTRALIRAFTLALLFSSLVASAGSAPSPKAADEGEALWTVLVRGSAHRDDPELKKLVGTKISLVGWIIPNEYDHEELVSFLLARYAGGCVHVPLPPPENVVYVTMQAKAKKLKNVTLTKRVVVEGVLTAASRVDASYEFTASSVKELD